MIWGSFGIVHLCSLAVAAAMIVGLYFLLKLLPERVRYWSLFLLSLAGMVAITYNLVAWNSPLEYLPFHMCSILAIMLPITVLTKSRYMGNLLLVWCLGSLLALIINHASAHFVIPSPAFFIYYIPHVLEFGVVIYLFKFGYVKKDYKCIPVTVGATVGIYTVVHLINLALTQYVEAHQIVDASGNLLQFNYMFSMTPDNPVLALFWKLIPHAYWYMYVAVVVLVVYLVVLYLPQILRAVRVKRASGQK